MKNLFYKILRFLMVGGIGFAVDAITYHLVRDAGTDPAVARLASLGWATAVTWLLNRRFTFEPGGRHAAEEGMRYVLVAIVAQGVNYLVFLTVIDHLPDMPHVAAIAFSAGLAAVFSFTGHFVFSFAPRAPELPKKDSSNAAI